ncbi:MAG: prolyl oligopeptidase family serine peptidase, partial [Selenomonadaceae bacterium]|nr:prolyl oligopeptidase family serine peptidase [Selenomonadaceae bacterium]
ADKFNIDKNKIAVMGMSAGGYLATMVGVTSSVEKFDFGDNLDQSSRVQAVVDIFGPTDLTKTGADYPKDVQKLYNSPGGPTSLLVNGVTVYKGNKGGSILDTPETARDSNPLTYIDKNTPPFLIMHGSADKTISPSQSKLLHDALIKNGISADYYILNGADHYAVYFYQPKAFGIIVDFLNRTLR